MLTIWIHSRIPTLAQSARETVRDLSFDLSSTPNAREAEPGGNEPVSLGRLPREPTFGSSNLFVVVLKAALVRLKQLH
jgi:hypothetical protein